MARRTKRDAQATRDAILDAAEALFEQEGVHSATLERIAAGADVTRGAVYWHFRDKEDILNALLQRADFPLDDLRRAGERAETGDALDELQRTAERCLVRLAEDARYRCVCRILLHGRVRLGEQQLVIREEERVRGEVAAAVARLFELARRQGALRADLAPAAAAWSLRAFMRGLHTEWLLRPQDIELASHAKPLLDAFFAGLRRR